MRKVIFLGPPEFTDQISSSLGSGFALRHIESELSALEPHLNDTAVIIDASMKLPLSSDVLTRMPALELVITASTGADHIASEELARKAVPLRTLADQKDFLRNITPAAEHSWLLLMASARRLRGAITHVQEGGWDRQSFPGMMLRGRSLGIVGCGRIGGWMARYARAFDMLVRGFDPYAEIDTEVFEGMSLNTLFAENDFISIHVPYNDETHELITSTQLSQMRPQSVLINTSRGAVVKEDDLVAGLEAGRPAFLGVDVLEHEPTVGKSLVWQYAQEHQNVIITPHIGGFSPDVLPKVLLFTASRVVTHFDFDQLRKSPSWLRVARRS